MTAPPSRPQRAVKTPKRITATYLHNAGLYYLQRFSASTGQFRRVMLRKVEKSCRAHPDQDRAACLELIENLIADFTRAGLLNDPVYAAGAVASLRRRGESARAIQARLKVKGLSAELVAGLLRDAAENDGQDDLRAALRFARRRRFGPFSPDGKLADADKAFASFGRAGFSYQIAKQVLTMEETEASALL